MRFSESWLRDLIELPVNSEQLLEQFNLAGLEVDSVETAAPAFNKVVVAEIQEISQHPDADRLRVCSVACGEAEPVQIVCGAANARQGLKAPLAMIGAVLPGGLKIKKGKLRGVASFGMLCSEAELGMAEKAEGLMELPKDAPVGDDIRKYLNLDDQVIEIDLTPNRGDCLGMSGLARECAAANRMTFSPLQINPVKPQIDDVFPVNIAAPEACPRYCGRVVRGIDSNAKTPLWMAERLRRGGIRTIHPVVDVTNYVMLELGQPMHAFDIAKLKGGVDVRLANDKETLMLLNGVEISLDQQCLLIADHSRALNLAGVMGGEDSGVSSSTQDIFFESAYFTPETIMGRARQFGLHTDSSHRYERGVDPQLQPIAIERATALLLEIAGGKAGPVVDINQGSNETGKTNVLLRKAQITRILGCSVPESEVEAILRGLGCELVGNDEGWQVTTPSYRFDLNIEVDLIEEIARIYGYESMPRRISAFEPDHPHQPETEVPLDRVRSLLTNNGYQETISYSFIDPDLQKLIEPDAEELALSNPISADLSVMRSNLMGSLLSTLNYNLKRQQKQLALFEVGNLYKLQGGEIKERPHIAGVRYGQRSPEGWNVSSDVVDFYDIKADVERLFGLGQQFKLEWRSESHPALHPGQSARVYLDDKAVGWVGAAHPSVLKAIGLPAGVFVFELELGVLLGGLAPSFSPVSKFPSIRRDLALVVDQNIGWEEVKAQVLQAGPDCLKEVRIFDVYAGEGVESGRKSFAIGLILQEISRTLTDVEIESATAEILAVLNKNLGATLRE